MEQFQAEKLEKGANAVFQSLLVASRGDKGVQAESLLCMIGAFGGYACQFAVRKALETGEYQPDIEEFRAQQLGDGRIYVTGSLIEEQLIGSQDSFCVLASVALRRLNYDILPDFQEIRTCVTLTFGTKFYGKIRVPNSSQFIGIAEETLLGGWNPVATHALEYCEIEELPTLFGMVAEKCIRFCKEAVHPKNALQIVVEAAYAMSAAALNVEP